MRVQYCIAMISRNGSKIRMHYYYYMFVIGYKTVKKIISLNTNMSYSRQSGEV
jgi:hypothetical protein